MKISKHSSYVWCNLIEVVHLSTASTYAINFISHRSFWLILRKKYDIIRMITLWRKISIIVSVFSMINTEIPVISIFFCICILNQQVLTFGNIKITTFANRQFLRKSIWERIGGRTLLTAYSIPFLMNFMDFAK